MCKYTFKMQKKNNYMASTQLCAQVSVMQTHVHMFKG